MGAGEFTFGAVGVFVIAFIVCLAITPVMIRVAMRYGLVDRPDSTRKLHPRPVACLGGVGLLLGWIAGVAFSGLVSQPQGSGLAYAQQHDGVLGGVMLGAGIVALTGLIDDLWSIRARYKLLGQMIAAAVLLVHGVGTSIPQDLVSATGGGMSLASFAGLAGPWLSVATVGLVILFVAGGCNAMNLLDGMDGLAGSVSAVSLLGLTIAGLILTGGLEGGGGHEAFGLVSEHLVLGLASLGAVLGFLPYNVRPARIFMGDAGSMLLGYLCVALILSLAEAGGALLILSGLAILALPILDTALAIVRRKQRGVSIACPDTYHLHHLLLRAGFSASRSVMLLGLLAVGFAALGCAMLCYPLHYTVPAFCGYAGAIAIIAYRFARQCCIEDRHHKAAGDTTMQRRTDVVDHLTPGQAAGHRSVRAKPRTAPAGLLTASEADRDTSGKPQRSHAPEGAHAA